jgi:hypothetical protein
MSKPNTIDGYNEQVTRDCERVLVTLLRNLGPCVKGGVKLYHCGGVKVGQ